MPIRPPGPRASGLASSFADLADRAGLVRLDRVFLAQLEAEDAGLHARLLAARAAPAALPEKAASELIVALGPVLEAFVAALFGIADDVLALARGPASWTRACLQASVRAAPGGEEIRRTHPASTARPCVRSWRPGWARR